MSIEAPLEACFREVVKCERAHDRATMSRGVGRVRSTAGTEKGYASAPTTRSKDKAQSACLHVIVKNKEVKYEYGFFKEHIFKSN